MPTFSAIEQTVTIAGVETPVRDSVISLASREVTRVGFIIDDQLAPSGLVPREGETFTIAQTIGDDSLTITGRIISATRVRGAGYSYTEVEGRSLADDARHRRFLKTAEGIDAGQLIRDAWNEYGPPGIDTSGVQSGPVQVTEYNSVYDSLSDLMSYLVELTGWAWAIEGGVLYWFDPLATRSADVVQADSDIERGSLEAKTSISGVYNVARQTAWRHETVDIIKTVSPPFCIKSLPIPDDLVDLDVYELVRVVESSNDGEATINKADKTVEFKPPISDQSNYIYIGPPGGAGDGPDDTSIGVTVEVRRQVWVESSRADSITLYGRREAPPLDNDGAMKVKGASQRLRQYLERHAAPTVSLSASLTRADIRPSTVCRFLTETPAIDRDLIVSSVRRTVSGTEAQIEVQAETADYAVSSGGAAGTNKPAAPASSADGNPVMEAVRRVERLERASMNPASRQGAFAEELGAVIDYGSVQGDWQWSGAFAITIDESSLVATADMALGDEIVLPI